MIIAFTYETTQSGLNCFDLRDNEIKNVMLHKRDEIE